jgi:hypothetical protein
VGNVVVPRTFYGVGKIFDTKAEAAKDSDKWMTFLNTTLPGKFTFAYLPDEPSPRQFPYIKRVCENIHSNPGPGGKLPALITHEYTDRLKDAIDIWCAPPGGFQPDMVQSLHARGKQQWFYNGGRPATGAVIVDAPSADCRMMAWAAFKHNADGYFYWHADHWQHNSQKQGERNQNVWANPVTFDNRGQPNKPKIDQGFINGDGVLFFPGTEKLHPEEDRGIPGPISSIQLANFRRGQQDHIYLTMAKNLGLSEVVKRCVLATVPAVFTQAPKDAVGFAQDGNTYEKARYELARAIAKAASAAPTKAP